MLGHLGRNLGQVLLGTLLNLGDDVGHAVPYPITEPRDIAALQFGDVLTEFTTYRTHSLAGEVQQRHPRLSDAVAQCQGPLRFA
ncbi:Uncharacterised protein [Mycobacteroides abscessus subsp. abscessus]|nr:Uncharacterised protein [Mycobacteroides abscessus subsp. abscessus]